MNKLSQEDRARVLHLLCEGQSIRATVRLTGISKNTISKLLLTAGVACMDYQDKHLVNLRCKRIEVDELWTFVGAKEKNVPAASGLKGSDFMGDVWTWVSLCADSKLIPAWYIGGRDTDAAKCLMNGLAKRLAFRVQLTSDGHRPYLEAVDAAFGSDIDYGMLNKIYAAAPEGPQRRYSPAECIRAHKMRIEGNPNPKLISTSYVERNNGIIRQHCRRYARLTQALQEARKPYLRFWPAHVLP